MFPSSSCCIRLWVPAFHSESHWERSPTLCNFFCLPVLNYNFKITFTHLRFRFEAFGKISCQLSPFLIILHWLLSKILCLYSMLRKFRTVFKHLVYIVLYILDLGAVCFGLVVLPSQPGPPPLALALPAFATLISFLGNAGNPNAGFHTVTEFETNGKKTTRHNLKFQIYFEAVLKPTVSSAHLRLQPSRG